MVNVVRSVYVDADENQSHFSEPTAGLRPGHGKGELSLQFSHPTARFQKLPFVFRWRFPHPSTSQPDFPT
jgi:hypothetical protein